MSKTSRDYPRMEIVPFGKVLLETEDLDPVYNMLYGADMCEAKMHRWLFAYWCYYSAGFASYVSERESDDYWDLMYEVAEDSMTCPVTSDGRWPRGRVRRYFRNERGTDAIAWFRSRYKCPELVVLDLITSGNRSVFRWRFNDLKSTVTKTWPMFGPWIAFKIADMLERVCAVPIDFTEADIAIYKEPKAAAHLWAEEKSDRAIRKAMGYLHEHLGHYDAPPRYERKVNLQELETVLCKWKSHMGGHYPMGVYTENIREGMVPWLKISETAQHLHARIPEVPLGTDLTQYRRPR